MKSKACFPPIREHVMQDSTVYLKPNVVIEPLYQQWYAWPHLISPATAAMNVLNRHLRIMDSFIEAPGIHEKLSRAPKLIGGPFMGHDAAKVGEVKELRDRTRRDYRHIVDFARAILDVTTMLRDHARGFSLEELYPRVPDILRGYVELFYELDNRPAFRFFESLLYKSEYYDVSAQSIALYPVEQDKRPFVLSTPRLADDGVLHLQIPFSCPRIDALFKMRTKAGSYRQAREMFDITDAQEPMFRILFTETAPSRPASRPKNSVRIRYFGHACILLEADGITLLTDPVISSSDESDVVRDTYADLPDRIDYVLITHNHQDHVLFETLLQLRHKIGQVIVPGHGGGRLEDPSLKLVFNAIGFRNVVELDELESLELPGCTLTGVPFIGEHADLNIRSKLCYHVRLASGFSALFAADSCNVEPELYRHVQKVIGDIDLLFLGMECDGAPLSWLYGPLLSQPLPREMDQSRRLAGCNFERASKLVAQFRPSEVYVYAMGQEPWLRHIMALEYTSESRPIIASNALVDECRSRGIVAKRLFGREVLNRGS
jgi:L-ascorbate metabolism protein UlaG (beta-lactamase superfamily)